VLERKDRLFAVELSCM